MRSSFTKILLVSAVLLLTACGKSAVENAIEEGTGGSANVDVNANGGVHVETKDGTYDAGNNTLPADWPADAPVYTNATVQYSGSATGTMGKPGAGAVFTTNDAVDTVVAFYKEQLKVQGWTISTTMESQGTSILGATKGTRIFSALIGSAEGKTTITVGVGEQ